MILQSCTKASSSAKFRSTKAALYMKAACLVLSLYNFWDFTYFICLFYLLLFLKFLTTWDLHTLDLHTGKLNCIEGGSNANSVVCYSTELHTWPSLGVL